MIKGETKMVKDNVPELMASLKELTQYDVLVGIPQEKTNRQETEDRNSITNAALGYIHEFGSPARNIPARPHLITGIKTKAKQISAVLQKGAKAAAEGHPEVVRQSLNAAGIIAVSAVKKKITDGPFAPLKAATIANRKRRGKSSEKPLIDTAQYRNSITYVLRHKPSGKTKQMILTETTKQKITKEWKNTPEG